MNTLLKKMRTRPRRSINEIDRHSFAKGRTVVSSAQLKSRRTRTCITDYRGTRSIERQRLVAGSSGETRFRTTVVANNGGRVTRRYADNEHRRETPATPNFA